LVRQDIVEMYGVKLLGDGNISVPLLIKIEISNSARKKIEKAGGKAIGLCGMDGSLLKAKKLGGAVNLGYVGEITKVNTDILAMALSSGYIPVVGSVALGEDDNCLYNINADLCAAKIAAALKAEKLVLLTDVPGVMRDTSDISTLISILRLHHVPKLAFEGIIKGGMIPKIDCCVEAIRMGVERAHIIDGRIPHSLLLELFSHEGIGTMIY
jgi:acetylglutamate kinase